MGFASREKRGVKRPGGAPAWSGALDSQFFRVIFQCFDDPFD